MLTLLRALWPDPPSDAYLTIWVLQGKISYHYPIAQVLKSTPEDIAELQAQLKGHDVYFGLGLRCPGLDASTRGGKKHVNWLPGWALDVDRADGVHKASNLPKTGADIDAILTDAPDPTAVVETGGGLHIYWAFPEPLELTCKAERDAADKAYAAFQQPFIDRAKALGFQLDKTASIDRVWRLPGFQNQKRRR